MKDKRRKAVKMTYNQAYSKTVRPRYKQDYNKAELAIITEDKAQIELLKRRHRNYILYKTAKVYKFVIIEL